MLSGRAERLRPRSRKLAELMDEAEDDELAPMSFQKEHWSFQKERSPDDPLKHLNGEIKRRGDGVAVFLNEPAIVRLVGRRPCARAEQRMGREAPVHEPGNA